MPEAIKTETFVNGESDLERVFSDVSFSSVGCASNDTERSSVSILLNTIDILKCYHLIFVRWFDLFKLKRLSLTTVYIMLHSGISQAACMLIQ